MWPFKSKDDRRIKKIVDHVVKLAVNELKHKGLISLYVAGTILTRDRIP